MKGEEKLHVMRFSRYKLGWLFALGLLATLLPHVSPAQDRLRRLRELRQRKQNGPVDTTPIEPRAATSCDGRVNVAFRILTFSNGVRAGVWYPTLNAENSFTYANAIRTSMASDNAPIANCGNYPLVFFSHGFTGCGTQSVFYTESLARAGYVVVAPDHKDAGCKVDVPKEGRLSMQRAEVPFRQAQSWTDKTYIDRRDDIETILNELPRMRDFSGHIDMQRVGASGHSLGGYTALGLAGGWSSWHDRRIKAVVAMSPYLAPYLTQERLRDIHVPVMYQGGTRDLGVTPGIKKSGGAYDASNAPKYFIELKGTGHFDWTIKTCGKGGDVESCVENPTGGLITRSAIEFFDQYLKGRNGAIQRPDPSAVADYRSAQ